MSVTAAHPLYSLMAGTWRTCRDACDSDRVKAAKTRYLPIPGGMTTAAFDDYVTRALYYGVTNRTVGALSGALFEKAPQVLDADEVLIQHGQDVTLGGVPFEVFALQSTAEVLTVARSGILIDMAPEESPTLRPYWVRVDAENVINWRTERWAGDEVLTRVVLAEDVEVPGADEFESATRRQYRVCELNAGIYQQRVFIEDQEKRGTWIQQQLLVPMRRGKPLGFIPFVFIGASTLSVAPERPPLYDLALVNLAHFRNSADLEHGLHYTGIPIPWASGVAPTPWAPGIAQKDGPISLGPSHLVLLEKGGEIGIVQADGQLLGALEKAMERKERIMAALGARLLESTQGAETATAIRMRHSGEHATLRSVAQVVELGLTQAWKIHAWWFGTEAEIDDCKIRIEINKEFFSVKASPEEVKTAMLAVQDDKMAYATFYEFLQRGGWAREGVTAKQEQEEIAKSGEMFGPDEKDEGTTEDDEDVIVEPGNPWRVVKRKGKFLVLKSDTGEVVGTHDTREAAEAQLRALHANVKD